MIDILRLVFGCPKLYSIPNILRATTGCFGPLPPLYLIFVKELENVTDMTDISV